MAIITPESKIQQEIVMWFNNNYCTIFHNPRFMIYSIPNGIPVPLPHKVKIRALDKLTKTGMMEGASDLEIRTDKRTINVEVKAETDQKPAQKEFEKRIKDLGGVYFIAYSLEDFKTKITQYL